MKIKNEKKLNLPQLIEWAYHEGSDVRDEKIESESMTVTFSEKGTPHIETKFHFLQVDELFTVEIEEVVDEDTELDLIERFIGGMGYSCYTTHRMTIKECLRRSPEECITTHFYIENDDQELVLIWRDGKLVE